MPHSDIHKRKRKKNWLVLGLIAVFIIVVWFITMIRIANAEEKNAMDILPQTETAEEAAESLMILELEEETENTLVDELPMPEISKNTPVMLTNASTGGTYDPYADPFAKQREEHLKSMEGKPEQWWNAYFFKKYER